MKTAYEVIAIDVPLPSPLWPTPTMIVRNHYYGNYQSLLFLSRLYHVISSTSVSVFSCNKLTVLVDQCQQQAP